MILEILQSGWHIFCFIRIFNAQYEEVNEPSQGVLVHGFDVCQVSN